MNPFELIKNAQKIQEKVEQMKRDLAAKSFTGTSGAGMVQVVMNGQQDILSVKISPEIVDPADVQTLEVLLASAVNNAHAQVQQYLTEQAQQQGADLGLGDLMKGGFPQ